MRCVATDVGVDLVVDAERTDALAAALRAARRRAVGEDAAEALRVERGRPRYGVDLDDTTIPQEAGLNERAVSFTKGCYVGQETVARLHYRGKPNRHLRGLRLSAPAQPGTELRLGEQGRRPCSAPSPRPGRSRWPRAPRGRARRRRCAVGEGDATAEVVELPFARRVAASRSAALSERVVESDPFAGVLCDLCVPPPAKQAVCDTADSPS